MSMSMHDVLEKSQLAKAAACSDIFKSRAMNSRCRNNSGAVRLFLLTAPQGLFGPQPTQATGTLMLG